MGFSHVPLEKRSDTCSLFVQDVSEHTQACVHLGLGGFDVALLTALSSYPWR